MTHALSPIVPMLSALPNEAGSRRLPALDVEPYRALYQEIVDNALAATGARFVNLSGHDPATGLVSGIVWTVGADSISSRVLSAARAIIPNFNPTAVAFPTDVNPMVHRTFVEGKLTLGEFREAAAGTVPPAILSIPGILLGVRYTLSIPMISSEGVVEASLAFHLPKMPSPAEQQTAVAFARQAALTLDNARLSSLLREQVAELQLLNQRLSEENAQRLQAEAENARLASEAARAGALEELNRLKSEFIAIASHELRTPLTTILGFSEVLQQGEFSHEETKRFVNVIHEDALRLASLVADFLDVSRIEQDGLVLDETQVDIGGIAAVLVRDLGASLTDHEVMVETPADARWVKGDHNKLRQVVENLVSNAIRYSPDGGQVQVRTRFVPDEQMVELSVSDQGLGIPEDHLERIFDRFHRVDSAETRSIRGTGLGLYIVRRLIDLHGGSVRVESAIGKGSTFFVYLPAITPLG